MRAILLSIFSLALLVVGGCHQGPFTPLVEQRVAPFSPRMGVDHPSPAESTSCTSCHDPLEVPGHKPADDCTGCHKFAVSGRIVR